jgi:flagellar biosynthesis protein FlhF
MRIKSYFTDSVEEAIEEARVELGPDAMLMNSKKTEPELRALGEYEVVFGVTSDVASASSTVLRKKRAAAPEMLQLDRKRMLNGNGGIGKGLAALLAATQAVGVAEAEAASDAPVAGCAVLNYEEMPNLLLLPREIGGEPVPPSLIQRNPVQNGAAYPADLSRELADLREQIEAVKRSMLQPRDWMSAPESISEGDRRTGVVHEVEPSPIPVEQHRSDAQEIAEQLTRSGFSVELAGEIGVAVAERLASERKDGSAAELRDAFLYAELSGRLRIAPGLSAPEMAAGRTVIFAGPAGSGKTTALLKLALRHSVTGRVPLQILSLDTLRVGGWEQLATYARIAGLPFNVIQNAAGLGQALAEYRGKRLILVDTPGLSPADWRETPELAVWIAREMARDSSLEVQLVLSAVTRPAVAQRTLEQFRELRPAKLLLTHLDEADAPGAVLEVAMRSQLPLSYVADGQQIPEDLEEAALERLLQPFAASMALFPRTANAA